MLVSVSSDSFTSALRFFHHYGAQFCRTVLRIFKYLNLMYARWLLSASCISSVTWNNSRDWVVEREVFLHEVSWMFESHGSQYTSVVINLVTDGSEKSKRWLKPPKTFSTTFGDILFEWNTLKKTKNNNNQLISNLVTRFNPFNRKTL